MRRLCLAATALALLTAPVLAEDEEEDGGLYDTWGSWSPDGETLWAYSYGYGGPAELFTIAPDGSHRERITHTQGNDWFPQISGDGAYLLFTSDRGYRPFASSQIYVQNRETGEEWSVSEGEDLKLTAHWSPDNQWITYAARPGREDEGGEIYIVGRDGTHRRRITHTPDISESAPSFHPDGTRLVWTEHEAVEVEEGEGRTRRQIVEYHLETGQTRILIGREHDAGYPQWSPDGQTLMFTSRDADGNNDIKLADAQGGHIRQLTDSPESDHGAHWSPDGTRISFATYRWGQSEVYVMNADGSDQRNVTRTSRDAD